MSIQEKKEWEVPVLTVLTRTNSQEHVLCGCKHQYSGYGPTQSKPISGTGSNCESQPDGFCKTKGQS